MQSAIVDKPIAGQLEYIQGKPEAKFRLALAGVQGGKTQIGCQEFARELFTNKNEVFMVVAPTYRLLWQSTMLKLKQVLDAMVPEQPDGKGWFVYLDENHKMMGIDRNGNIVFFRSCSEPDTLRGTTVKAVFFDECASVMSPEPFRILRQRVAVKGGRIYMTTTPKGANWLLKEVYKPWEAGNPDYHVVRWRSIDNPAFPIQEYEDAKKYQDPRWVAQEYDAEFSDLGGLVFGGAFDEKIHVGFPEYDPLLPVYWGVDFGIANPAFIGFWQILPPPVGQVEPMIHMLDELQLQNLQFADVLHIALHEKRYKKPAYVCCDPSGKHRDQVAGIGTIDVMTSDPYRLSVRYSKKWNQAYMRMKGIMDMWRLLKMNRIMFHKDRCFNMIRAFSLYSRSTKTPEGGVDERPTKDGISDHPMEAAFYFLLGRPRFFVTREDVYRHDADYEPSSEWTGI